MTYHTSYQICDNTSSIAVSHNVHLFCFTLLLYDALPHVTRMLLRRRIALQIEIRSRMRTLVNDHVLYM